MSETDLFEDYTLPFPLDSYIKPPVPDENQAKFTSDNPVECSKCLLKFANLTKLQSQCIQFVMPSFPYSSWCGTPCVNIHVIYFYVNANVTKHMRLGTFVFFKGIYVDAYKIDT